MTNLWQHPQHLQAPPPVPVDIEVTGSTPVGRAFAMPVMVEFAPGYRFKLRKGRNQVLLPPGRFRAQLWSQYTFWQVGKASLDVDTTRGPVYFHYASPHTIYHRGAAGYEPQQRPGLKVARAWTIAYWSLLAAGLLLAVAVAVLR
ncbi:hypothetical protein [Nocardia carnea]|uniref:hypothetical protein n=1 Tax=Nocardia carnea TaxID=37328 RepID=UPI002454D80C|nr:hypothetical protein [Nocardia carnea]